MNIVLDKHGHLPDMQCWTPEIAKYLATTDGLDLTSEHLEVIELMRGFYQKYLTIPTNRALINLMKHELGKEKGNSIYLQRLFPRGAARQASLIAGLPKPARCI